MTYTAIAALSCVVVLGIDRFGLRTRLTTRTDFWIAYAIVLVFQLATNAVLTGREVVRYADDTIVGTGNDVAPPAMFGPGRILFAPIEDLVFGFALILLTLILWIWLGRRGLQRTPFSGPPRWRDDRTDPDPAAAAG
jgi:lycopene cyclase domain-containing protein